MNYMSLLSIIAIIFFIIFGLTKRSSLTNSLVLGNLIVFFFTILSLERFGFFIVSPVQLELGFRPAYLTNMENLYTLFTQMFVHSTIAHIFFNMLFLFLIGGHLESRIGKPRFLLVYLFSGIVGVLAESLAQWNSAVLIIGASGAISGAMGALIYLYPRDEIPMFLGPLFLPKVPVWLSVGSWFAIQLAMAFVDTGPVAYMAHIGGFLGGALLASILAGTVRKAEESAIGKALHSTQSIESLEELATTEELMSALSIIKKERFDDVRKAWLEYFARKARCTRCGSEMSLQKNKIRCNSCGFEVKIE